MLSFFVPIWFKEEKPCTYFSLSEMASSSRRSKGQDEFSVVVVLGTGSWPEDMLHGPLQTVVCPSSGLSTNLVCTHNQRRRKHLHFACKVLWTFRKEWAVPVRLILCVWLFSCRKKSTKLCEIPSLWYLSPLALHSCINQISLLWIFMHRQESTV